MPKLTPDASQGLQTVLAEIALARFACHGLNGGLTMGEAEIDGLYATLDRWHRALSLALNSDPEEGSTHD